MSETKVLHCHCAWAKIIPAETKERVLERLQQSGVPFEAVPDLCEMSARKDPALAELASGPTRISACFPRAVKWLFHAAGTPLPEEGVEVVNMRAEDGDAVADRLLEGLEPNGATPPARAEVAVVATGEWKPWFPVIDFDRCTNCMQCLTFCLFDVYGVDQKEQITVRNEDNCKTDCPACSRVCPEAAILFPKYKKGPINGDEVRPEDLQSEAMKVDISALLGGDIYGALRTRQAESRQRFSTERDESKALLERKRCLKKIQDKLDIPDEVLMTLPSAGDIEERAERAREKMKRREERSQTMRDTRPVTEDDWGI